MNPDPQPLPEDPSEDESFENILEWSDEEEDELMKILDKDNNGTD